MPLIKDTDRGLELQVRVQPRSSKNRILGRHGENLKIKVTAPAVENAANTACIRFLAEYLAIPKSAVRILSGQHSRTKRILLQVPRDGDAPNEKKRLKALIEPHL